MKSSSAESWSAARDLVPLRSKSAVIEAVPSLPAGSATEPALTANSKLTMGTSWCSISSSVSPLGSLAFLWGGSLSELC